MVKLSTSPREKELLSFDQYTKEFRLPDDKVSESIVETQSDQ